MSKFQLYKDAANKFRFRLRKDNDEIIAVGEAYEQHAGCINGIKSVVRNSKAPIQDLTIENVEKVKNPKYEIFKGANDRFRFRLKASNGETIAEGGQAYLTKVECLEDLEIVRGSPAFEVEDLTIASTPSKESNVLGESAKISEKSTAETQLISRDESGRSVRAEEIPKIDTSVKDSAISEEAASLAQPVLSEESGASLGNKEVYLVEEPAKNTIETGGLKLEKEDEMLAELKKIREAVQKLPEPASPKGMWNEFKDFLSKYKILGLAIAFVLGLYLGTLVQALVTGFVMPLIGLALPGLGNLAEAFFEINNQKFLYGNFISALITFIIVAFIAFIVVKVGKKWKIE